MQAILNSDTENNQIAPFRGGKALTVNSLMLQYGLTQALQQNITELAINQPLEYWIEDVKGWHRVENKELTLGNIQSLAIAIGIFNGKPISQDNPIASLTLPAGERCQIVMPPVCEKGKISMTIRKPSSSRFSLSDYAKTGRLTPKLATLKDDIEPWEVELLKHASNHDYEAFFTLAVEHHLNIVTVGGTGSGKTTFSKTLIDLYPSHRRLFTVEDAHELTTPLHPNCVHLFFSPTLSSKTVLASCMRMKPDHIFITELRGDETWDYLMSLQSGHNGSVTSIHANDCRGALYKMASYIKQSDIGKTLAFDFIMEIVQSTIDVVVYFDKTYLTELYYDPRLKLKILKGEA